MTPLEIIPLITFVLLLVSIIINFKEIKRHFSGIRTRIWIVVILIFIAGFCLRIILPLCDTQDGLIWKYALGGKDILEGEETSRYMQQPKGYPILLFLTFLISGPSYISVMIFNILLSSLTLILVFLITYLITKDERAGLFSMLFLAFFPMSIFFSQWGATEITSVFFVSLSVLFFLVSLKNRTLKMFILVFVSLVFSSYVRLENLIIFPPLFILCYAIFMKNKKEFKKLIIPIVVFIMLSVYLSYFIIHGDAIFGPDYNEFPPDFPKEYYKETFSMKYLPDNLIFAVNGLLESQVYPLLLYFLMIFSLLSIRKFPKLIIPVLWVLFSLIFFGRFWGFRFAGADLYLTILHPPFSILYGVGIVYVMNFLTKNLFPNKQIGKNLLLILLFLVTLYPNVQILSHMGYDDLCYTKDTYSAGSLLDDCTIVEKTINYDLGEIVKFILPGENISHDTTNCKKGYFMKIYDERFEEIFGAPLKNNTFENCTLLNITENFKAVDIFRFVCQ